MKFDCYCYLEDFLGYSLIILNMIFKGYNEQLIKMDLLEIDYQLENFLLNKNNSFQIISHLLFSLQQSLNNCYKSPNLL